MVGDSLKFIAVLIIVIFSGCNSYNSYYLTKVNALLNKQRKDFGKESYKNKLLNHFPSRIKDDSISFGISEPTSPPTYMCYKQFGDVFLVVDKSDYQKELAKLLKEKMVYKTAYNDNNIIINLSELRRNIFPIAKCNKWYADKLPIPYFESYDFGLGEKETRKDINGESYFNYTHTIPSDLQVYVIEAEAGDFWKESCNEKRPEVLKEWQHGYSKGFAISDEENIIVYWTMIW